MERHDCRKKYGTRVDGNFSLVLRREKENESKWFVGRVLENCANIVVGVPVYARIIFSRLFNTTFPVVSEFYRISYSPSPRRENSSDTFSLHAQLKWKDVSEKNTICPREVTRVRIIRKSEKKKNTSLQFQK